VVGGYKNAPWDGVGIPPGAVVVTLGDGREWEVMLISVQEGDKQKLLVTLHKHLFTNPNRVPTTLEDNKMVQAVAIVWYETRFRHMPLNYGRVDWTDAL
jgi:hypothetical protein